MRLLLFLVMNLTVAAEQLIYIGTYTRTTSQGIYAVRFDPTTGTLGTPELVAQISNPSFISLSPGRNHLYAVSESDAMVVPFSIDPATSGLTPKPARGSDGKSPCYLAIDRTGRALIVANYHTGRVAVFPIATDGTLAAPHSVMTHSGKSVHPTRQAAPHIHSATFSPDNRYAIVCDLGLDRIFIYAFDPVSASLTPAATPYVTTAPGAGPRHSAFAPDGRHAFVINELDSTLSCFAYEPASGALTLLATHSTLPANFSGDNYPAEVRVHPNGRFVYGSNRGHDSIAVFAFDHLSGQLTPLEWRSTGGRNPRNFTISPDGTWLLAANQDSNSIKLFRVNVQTGRLSAVEGGATVPMPVCVLFDQIALSHATPPLGFELPVHSEAADMHTQARASQLSRPQPAILRDNRSL